MIYIPSPTGKKFHEARNSETGFVRTIIGPIGSGKSVTCVIDLMLIAMDQQAIEDKDGRLVRYTKFAIIRNTYRELLDTTISTFFMWIPKETGHWSTLNMSFKLEQELPDGTVVDTEFLFRALDKPDDIKKLLSLEITAAWINEAREIAKAVFEMVQGRCGRYPQTILDQTDPNYWSDPDNCRRLYGPSFHGVIMDTNPPPTDHWYYKTFEENIPPNHRIFHQPSGISPNAENKRNLVKGYYQNMMQGKTQEWIKVYVHGQYGFIADGLPVWPEYKDDVHYNPTKYTPDTALPIEVGLDFGLTPAAVFGQITPTGRMVVFDELVTFNMGAMNFGKILKEKLQRFYPEHVKLGTFNFYGDPAGEHRADTDEQTPYMILANQGIIAYPTYTNDYSIRREAVADYMQRLDFSGKPAFLITQGAPTVRTACAGGYQFKRMQVSGEERFQDKPDKGQYSHAGDALQYLFLGAVGGARVIGGLDGMKAIDYSKQMASYR